ncbi:hypothetical protein GCWU000342_00292 [Shuttleworthella satelles DSM 14600]|uniref:Uncharacterized protein n=1 Tax=Shuttleworthella satelles DSM 14600 TaxID=626523 RepID=C4G8J6_9FIRM|nr:hypothetical protein GCWU000342_00292 [Shuttleworthia satelles DSM 14600]
MAIDVIETLCIGIPDKRFQMAGARADASGTGLILHCFSEESLFFVVLVHVE